ncbi:hypothetical protein DD606_25170 [Enterobacter cloacae complex sp. GF14B]|nr:hypothetical protein DD606_25170 [Enterobacter cloacae complex sp. GF14B]
MGPSFSDSGADCVKSFSVALWEERLISLCFRSTICLRAAFADVVRFCVDDMIPFGQLLLDLEASRLGYV